MGHKKRNKPSRSKPSGSRAGELAESLESLTVNDSEGSDSASYESIKVECEKALSALSRGNHNKALRAMKNLCVKHSNSPYAALVHRAHVTVYQKMASLGGEYLNKDQHMKDAIESAKKATVMSPDSIEFAHFYANLLYEGANEGNGYEEAVKECERALAIESPDDPGKELLLESQVRLPTPEARIKQVVNEIRNLIQMSHIASISTLMKHLRNGDETFRLIPITSGAMELSSVQPRRPSEIKKATKTPEDRRPDEIKKATKTPEDRRKEIEAQVAAARWLLMQNSESGPSQNEVANKRKKHEESQVKLLAAEARVQNIEDEFRNLIQKINIASIATWMKQLRDGDGKSRLISASSVLNDLSSVQPRRPTKTPEERRKEIEAQVAAARLLMQKSESGQSLNEGDKGLDPSTEKDATEKSDAAREAFLAELALDSEKNSGGGNDNLKHATEKTKAKKRNKDYRKRKGAKASTKIVQPIHDHETSECISSRDVTDKENEGGELIIVGSKDSPSLEECKLGNMLEEEERKLEETSEYQRKIENEAKLKYLAGEHEVVGTALSEKMPGGNDNLKHATEKTKAKKRNKDYQKRKGAKASTKIVQPIHDHETSECISSRGVTDKENEGGELIIVGSKDFPSLEECKLGNMLEEEERKLEETSEYQRKIENEAKLKYLAGEHEVVGTELSEKMPAQVPDVYSRYKEDQDGREQGKNKAKDSMFPTDESPDILEGLLRNTADVDANRADNQNEGMLEAETAVSDQTGRKSRHQKGLKKIHEGKYQTVSSDADKNRIIGLMSFENLKAVILNSHSYKEDQDGREQGKNKAKDSMFPTDESPDILEGLLRNTADVDANRVDNQNEGMLEAETAVSDQTGRKSRHLKGLKKIHEGKYQTVSSDADKNRISGLMSFENLKAVILNSHSYKEDQDAREQGKNKAKDSMFPTDESPDILEGLLRNTADVDANRAENQNEGMLEAETAVSDQTGRKRRRKKGLKKIHEGKYQTVSSGADKNMVSRLMSSENLQGMISKSHSEICYSGELPMEGATETAGVKVYGTGLQNEIGEYNCFLNVIIQSLWNLSHFRDEFLRSSSNHVHIGNPCVTCALYGIFTALCLDTQREAVAPTSLRTALSNLYPDSNFFQEGEMNDASEVLDAIFDCLHQSFASDLGSAETKSTSTRLDSWDCTNCACIVHSIFGMDIFEKMLCPKCNLESRHLKYTAFFHLINANALRMTKVKHQESSFDELMNLVQRDHLLSCDPDAGGCGKHNFIEHFLSTPPHVFTIVLGWKNTCESLDDIRATLAAISTEIDISVPYHGLDPNNRYSLASVVSYYRHHYHCVAYSRHHEKWIMYDDVTVKVIGSWDDVLMMCIKGHLQPQVFFYEAAN